ncbi:MAG: hypothetical protein AMXMBFR82_49880 [Candidatus Hydrogenedentota bacterium]
MQFFYRLFPVLLVLPAYAQDIQAPEFSRTQAVVRAEDVQLHVDYLASEAMEGRLTGTEGERLATEYAARVFEETGLTPAGENGTWFQPFEFTAGVSLGSGNRLCIARTGVPEPDCYPVDEAWRPLAFSKTGSLDAPVVFAGYGIVAPALEELPEYDSYVHLDVTGKWVVVFRYIPEDISTERRLHLTQYASLRYKAMVARDRGAAGIVFVSGPNSQATDPLVGLQFDASFSGTSVAAVSVTDRLGEALLSTHGRTLEALQSELDTGEPVMGFEPPDVRLQADIDIVQEKRTGRNVLGRLAADEDTGKGIVVVGAHIDHLGRGRGSGSLARDHEREEIHYGADDNASGVAGIFEIAQYLMYRKERGEFAPVRDIVFAGWSGEELGLLGSAKFVQDFGDVPESEPLTEEIAAYVNLDMIGRMREAVVIGGVGSSSIWADLLPGWQKVAGGLKITTQDDSFLPTDATSFFVRGVPFINAFTGAHEEYHSPRDTPDTINYNGAARIARFMAEATIHLAEREEAPDYIPQAQPAHQTGGAGMRAYLGTIPDYSQDGGNGLKLAGVAEGGPAEQAGVKGGDLVVELGGATIENIYDYTYAIEALKIGEPVSIVVLRGGKRIELEVTPRARE